MSRGVVLISLGHVNYGNYALQLARSIKYVDDSIPITLCYNNSSIGHIKPYLHTFGNTIEIPKEYYITNGLNDYIKAKTHLYDLSPYEETIYIDADVIWCPQKKITELFNEVSESNITIANRGKEEIKNAKAGFIHWAKPSDIASVYGNEGWIYNLASEMIYFKKCIEVESFFEVAKEVYLNPQINYKKFAHHLPDELAFEIAILQTGVSFRSPYLPFYWEQAEKKALQPHKIYKDYYAYSMGGNTNTTGQEQIYNNLANHYNSKFKVNGYYPAKNKKNWLNERKDI